jgi:glycosyltransferase involved in cell wall biosynthesis
LRLIAGMDTCLRTPAISQPARAADQRPTIGVLIRFANSVATLPRVLAALREQTCQPHEILGVANESTDGSCDLMHDAGARVIEWSGPYEHSKVLNFGMRHLTTDLVLVLSSHTVLESPDAIRQLVAAFDDPLVACASARWDDDPYYSDAVTWDELFEKGLRFGSIYSNSMGMIRRRLWEELPFDEAQLSSEDYAWAIHQIRRGGICRRLDFPFSYQRNGSRRDREFAEVTFRLARRHRLPVAWLGLAGSIRFLAGALFEEGKRREREPVLERLKAWADVAVSA